jgi:hypothetical protein
VERRVHQQAADSGQLEMLPRARRQGNRSRPQGPSFSAWIKRDAELHAALEVAEEIGDARQANAARRRWQEHMRTIPPVRRRRGGRPVS